MALKKFCYTKNPIQLLSSSTSLEVLAVVASLLLSLHNISYCYSAQIYFLQLIIVKQKRALVWYDERRNKEHGDAHLTEKSAVIKENNLIIILDRKITYVFEYSLVTVLVVDASDLSISSGSTKVRGGFNIIEQGGNKWCSNVVCVMLV